MKQPPVAPVIHKTDRQWTVSCPYRCKAKKHIHGPGEGHRVAHCVGKSVTAGYLLVDVVQEVAKGLVSHPEVRKIPLDANQESAVTMWVEDGAICLLFKDKAGTVVVEPDYIAGLAEVMLQMESFVRGKRKKVAS